jgi:cytochrome c oxidase subunit IV
MSEHVSSRLRYVMVFLALLVGTGLTIIMARVDLGPWNDTVALVIAFTKATLVVLFFMHVSRSSLLTKLTVVAGLFFLLIMITMTMSDYVSRGWLHTFAAH